MSKFNIIYPRVFMTWLFLSAFYYIGNFIGGDVIADRESDIIFKAAKYAFAISVSLIFVYYHRSYKLGFSYLLILIFFNMGLLLSSLGYEMKSYLDVFIVIGAFFGFVHIGSKITARGEKEVIHILVFSGFGVALISYFEFLFMGSILGDYWEKTGGFRSVSTLLNPNNLGIYLGAILIIGILSDKMNLSKIGKLLIYLPILGALLLSGSRTAFLSLFAAALIAAVAAGRITAKSIIRTSFYLFVFIFLVLTLFLNGNLPERAVDFYTAELRLAKYFQFVLNFNSSYLYPDFDGLRSNIVSESSYFYIINSLGLIVSLIFSLCTLLILLFNNIRIHKYYSDNPFVYVCIFYLIAMFFENVLMSFPNNQLFFLSFGLAISHSRYIRESEYQKNFFADLYGK